ncbi:MAG TPA: DUF5666 domain-containing protein [Anaerolineales bacterium]|nr:DUF5666 domain-containing protein [Anaerolineales bacterium]
MSDIDDLLQKQLEALESGKPLDTILDELPEEAAKLSDLVQLASAVRGLPHPQPELQRNLAPRRRQPTRSRLAAPLWRFDWLQLRPALLISGSLVTAMVVLVMFASLVAAGLWLAGPRNARAATLMSVSGPVEVASNAASADWRLVSDGTRVVEGQRVRTGDGASVTLVFYEGTRADLGSYTDVTLQKVEGGWGKTLQVVLDQRMGETVHSVVPLRGENSLYHVNTPTGTASVFGTTFSVDVDLQGQARFAVNKGKVRVSTEGSEVWLAAGQITAVDPGLKLLEPSYQFELKGLLEEKPGEGEVGPWRVNGVYFDLADNVVIEGDPQVGDYVEVEGHVLGGGALEAYHIEAKTSSETKSSFKGVLDSMDPWVVSGIPLSVVEGVTDLDDNLAVDDPVEVTFEVQADGSWLALKIESLVEEPEPEPETEPALTLTKSASPTQYSAVDEVISYSFVISNTGDVDISGPFTVSDDKTMDESCPAEPASLAPGESLTCTASYTITQADLDAGSVTNIASATADNDGNPVTSNEDTATVYSTLVSDTGLVLDKSASPTEFDAVGDVIVYTYVVSNTGTEPINGPFSVTDDKISAVDCSSAPASLGTGESFTCTASYTILPEDLDAGSVTNVAYATADNVGVPLTSNTDTETVTSSLETDCTGNESHPKGQKLAEEHGVPYAEIMGWFCQRFGFGEIDLGYTLAETYMDQGITAAQLFEMRRAGQGWGQIKNWLKTLPTTPTDEPTDLSTTPGKPDKPKGPKDEPPGRSNNPKPQPPAKPNGSNRNQSGQGLATRYGVSYDSIMGWYNQGYSFSDIDQAYSLSQSYGVPVGDIFTMRAAGKSWGQIRQELRGKPSKKP